MATNILDTQEGKDSALLNPVAPVSFDPIGQQAAQVAKQERRGAFAPLAGELGALESGERTGFLGSIESGFSGGLVGFSFDKFLGDFNPEEQAAFDESARNYAENNPWKNLAGEIVGRTISDLPIDLAVGFGMTQASRLLVKAGRVASVSQKSVDKIEQASDTLRKLAGDPNVNITTLDKVKRDALEGLATGFLSESALQAMGKGGTSQDIITAALADSAGGVALGQIFRTVGSMAGFAKDKFAKEAADAVEETTGIPSAEVLPTIQDQLNEHALLVEAKKKFETAQENEAYLASIGKTPEDTLRDISENFVRRSAEAENLIKYDDKGKLIRSSELDNQVQRISHIIKATQSKKLTDAERADIVARDTERRQREIEVGGREAIEGLAGGPRALPAEGESSFFEIAARKKQEEAIEQEGLDVILNDWQSTVDSRRQERAVERARLRESKKGYTIRQQTEDILADLEADLKADKAEVDQLIKEVELGAKQAGAKLADDKAAAEAVRAAQIHAAQLQVKAQKVAEHRAKIKDDTRLLGDDLAALSKETGVPVKDLEVYRQHAFEKMREAQATKRANEVDVQDIRAAHEINGQITRGELPVPAGKVETELPAVRNLDEFGTMMRNTLDRELPASKVDAFVGLAQEMVSRRAKAIGLSAEKWLSVHNITYKDSGGPHVLFDDHATILNAPAKATSVGDFFHELGHIFEADLDKATREALSDAYGKDMWSTEFSEKFSNDFLRYLRSVDRGTDTGFPKSLKEAFNRVARWLGEVFRDLTGNTDIDPQVKEIFDKLFIGKDKRTTLPRLASRRKTFLKNIDEPVRFRTADELEDQLVDVIGKNAKEISAETAAVKKAFEDGTVPLAQDNFMNTVINKLPKFLGAGILTPQNLFNMVGMGKVYNELLDGVTVETRLVSQRLDAMKKKLEARGLDEKALNTMEGKKAKVKWSGGEREVSAQEALLLHMYAKDGSGGDKWAQKNSARFSLVNKESGYRFQDGDRTVFSREDVEMFASDRWLREAAGDEAVNFAGFMRDTLDDLGSQFNNYYRERAGKDAFQLDEEGKPLFSYFMKHTSESKSGDKSVMKDFTEQFQKELTKMVEEGTYGDSRKLIQTLADTTALNRVRQGTGILEFQDPFGAVVSHMNQLSRLEAIGDPLTKAHIMHQHLKGDIKELTKGKNNQVWEAMGDILERSSGQSVLDDPIANKTFNRIFKGQVLAALSWNLSPILKQPPAILSALARLENMKGDAATATRMLKTGFDNKIVDAEGKEQNLHEFLLENSPTYSVRYRTSGQSPDISDAVIADSFRNSMYGGIKVSDALETQGLKGGLKAMVQTGMGGIRESDAVTMRSIYMAVKESLGEGATPEQVENAFSRVVNETQSTHHPLTRSAIQSSRNILHRQMAMFSGESTKNFNMLIKDIQELQTGNLKGDELIAAKKRVRHTIKLLAMQAAAVAAAGVGANKAKNIALDAMSDEEVVAERDKYLEAHGLEWARVWREAFQNTVGTMPYSGPILAELLTQGVVGSGFDVEIMPIDFINDTYDWAASIGDADFGKNSMKVAQEAAKMMYGLPATFVQAGKAVGSNF